jgi:hypothetical protein
MTATLVRVLITGYFAVAVMPAMASNLAEVSYQAQVTSEFTRYQRAWHAFQLAPKTAQYNIGDVVTAVAAPNPISQLFSVYRVVPKADPTRTYQLLDTTDTTTSLCVTATLKSAAQLDGFVSAMRALSAQMADASCLPSSMPAAVSFPMKLSARKAINAAAAQALGVTDSSERAAQAAVSGTVTATLPSGKLLDFSSAVGTVSASQTFVLTNTSNSAWSLNPLSIAGQFTASPLGCATVLVGGNCQVTIEFNSTTSGRKRGFLTVSTSTGVTLVIRLGGQAS